MPSESANAAQTIANRLRTWDYHAARCIQIKLGHFPASQVACNKDKEGKCIHPKVVDELMRLRPVRKHVPLEFLTQIIKDHGLRGGFASALPPPPNEEVVDK